MRLVFDTETSGLRKEKLSPGDLSQPRIVQLAAGLYTPQWRRVGGMSVLIKPSGWAMEQGAEKAHGIPEAMCHKYGVPIAAALALFQFLCDAALQIVGHNIEFDRGMITTELEILKASGLWWQKKSNAFACTQELATPLCQLPGKFGFKYPSLAELFSFLFPGEAFEQRHDAEHDEKITARCAQELERRGILQPARSRHPVLDAGWRKL